MLIEYCEKFKLDLFKHDYYRSYEIFALEQSKVFLLNFIKYDWVHQLHCDQADIRLCI